MDYGQPVSKVSGRPHGRVTIMDVARAAGVSVATVSKVINGRYGVAEATSQRVEAIIDELGYESSIVASSLRRKRTGIIGVLVTEFEPYSAELLKGISSAMAGSGYELLAHAGNVDTHGASGWERRTLSRLGRTLIDAAIIVTPSTLITDQAGIPVVAIDPHTGPEGPRTVDSDNLHGAQLAAEHLLDLGHRRIAYLGGRPDLRSAHLREEGFRAALSGRGLMPDPDLMRIGGYSPEITDAPARELLSLPPHLRPTAIFAASDPSAFRVLEVAAELGLRVPEDVSVVGYDDVPDAAGTTPALTTVRQPLQEMGSAAVRAVLAELTGPANAPEASERHLRLPVSLRVRSSTAPPADS